MANVSGGTVLWTLDADEAPLRRKLDSAKQSVRQVSKEFEDTDDKANTSFSNIAKGALAFVGVTSVLDTMKNATVGAVAAFGDFEQNLSVLRVVTNATGAEMQQLSNLAQELGRDVSLPGVSAADAALAMTELGKAGLAVNDVLGASKGVLQAAKAGNIGVADSAKIVSGALLAFNLQGKEATRVADLFAGAANASSAEIHDLGLGLQQTSAVANSLKVPVEDAVVALAGLANAGLRASDAGTSLKTFFASLTPDSKPAVEAMKRLGISFFDAQGNFVGLRRSIELLQTSTAGLTQEQRQLTIEQIFGSDASRAAIVLANQGVQGFDKLKGAITEQGVAAQVAAARTSGIKGSLEALKSALETAALGFGQFISGAIKPLVDFAAGNLPVALGIVAGAVVGIGAAVAAATPAVGAFAASMLAAVAAAAPFIAGGAVIVAGLVLIEQKFGAISGTIGAVAKAFQGLFDLIVKGDFTSAFGQAFGQAEDSPLVKFILDVRSFFVDTVKEIVTSVQGIFSQLGDSLRPVLQPVFDFFSANRDLIINVLKGIAIGVAAVTFGPAAIAIGVFIGALKLLAIALEFLNKNFETIKNVILTVVKVAFAPIAAVIFVVINVFKLLLASAEALGKVFATVFGVIGKVVTAAFTAIAAVWNTILKPIFDAIIFILQSILQFFTIVFTGIFQIVSTILVTLAQIIFITFQGIFDFLVGQILQPIFEFFVSTFTNIFNFVSGIVNAIATTVQEGFNLLSQFIIEPISRVVGQVAQFFTNIFNTISGIVNGIFNTVRDKFNQVREAIIGPVRGALDFLGGIFNGFVDAGKNIVTGFLKGLSDGKDAVVNKIKEICEGALDAVKKFFGISSPSKVMMGIGDFLMQGLTQGIEQGSSAAVSAATDASDAIVGSFSGQPGLATPVSASPIGVDGQSGIGAASSGATIVQNNTILNQVDMDTAFNDLAWRLAN